METLAPAIAAPAGSVTVPSTLLLNCAFAPGESTASARITKRIHSPVMVFTVVSSVCDQLLHLKMIPNPGAARCSFVNCGGFVWLHYSPSGFLCKRLLAFWAWKTSNSAANVG